MKQEKKIWNSSTCSFILVATAQYCNHELNSTFLVQVICNWKLVCFCFCFLFVLFLFCFVLFCFCFCFVLFCFCSSVVFLFILICVIFLMCLIWIISHCTLTEYTKLIANLYENLLGKWTCCISRHQRFLVTMFRHKDFLCSETFQKLKKCEFMLKYLKMFWKWECIHGLEQWNTEISWKSGSFYV